MWTTDDRYTTLLDQIASIYEETRQDLSPEGHNRRTLDTNWRIGERIVEIEQDGKARAAYGTRLIYRIAADLTARLGAGFSQMNVLYMRQYYTEYQIPSPGGELSWSHYKALMSLKSKEDRALLEQRAIAEKLSKTALWELTRQMNRTLSDDDEGVPVRALRPRKGELNIVKLVEVVEGLSTLMMADCGFRVLALLPRRRPRKLREGEYLQVSGPSEELSTRRIECAAGERYCYQGHLQRVVDGDTVEAVLDLALGGATLQRLRLRGVDAPELGTPEGEAAKQALMGVCRPGDAVKVLTYHHDVHGRYVADLFLESGRFVNMEYR